MKNLTLLEKANKTIDSYFEANEKNGLKEYLKLIVNTEGTRINWKAYIETKRTWEMKCREEAQIIGGDYENLSSLWDRFLIVLTMCGIFAKKPEDVYFFSSSKNPFSSANDDFGAYLRSEFLLGNLYFTSEQDAKEYANAYRDVVNETYPWKGRLYVYKITRLDRGRLIVLVFYTKFQTV